MFVQEGMRARTGAHDAGLAPLPIPHEHALPFSSGVASGVASRRALKDVLRRTFCVVSTWRTGQEEFKVFMKKKVPSCNVYV
jgi:hypothetical protein